VSRGDLVQMEECPAVSLSLCLPDTDTDCRYSTEPSMVGQFLSAEC